MNKEKDLTVGELDGDSTVYTTTNGHGGKKKVVHLYGDCKKLKYSNKIRDKKAAVFFGHESVCKECRKRHGEM